MSIQNQFKLSFVSNDVLPVAPDLFLFRRMMQYAYKDGGVASAFYRCTRSIEKSELPLWVAFKALSEFMMYHHLDDFSEEFPYFNVCKDLMEYAIEQDDMNVEIHWIRFVIQDSLPEAFGYNNSLKADKEILMNYLNDDDCDQDRELRNNIVQYLERSGHLQ